MALRTVALPEHTDNVLFLSIQKKGLDRPLLRRIA